MLHCRLHGVRAWPATYTPSLIRREMESEETEMKIENEKDCSKTLWFMIRIF
jgi:hypothetical protein